jgi:hypothetical protein
MPGEHFCQRGLTGTIRSHDRVNLALIDRQVDAFEYLFAIDARV